ncbi:hypothetical protein KQI63_06970 [bacterium]|nr:hypothetical protein [bacterium]
MNKAHIEVVLMTLALMFAGCGQNKKVDQAMINSYVTQGDSARHEGDWQTAGMGYVEALNAGSESPKVAWRAAQSFARNDETDIALRYLLLALKYGYRDQETLAEDPAFSEMRESANWDVVEERVDANQKAWLDTTNVAVYNLMLADQADREQAFSTLSQEELQAISDRDEARRDSLLTILGGGGLRTADDYFHAALISQHGADSSWYKRAYELSKKATELDSTHKVALWLTAASWDRYLQSVGQPQVYGTQYYFFRDTETGETSWTMEPYDTTAVSDKERLRLGVGSLAEQRANLLEMQGGL